LLGISLNDENEVLWWAKGSILKGESPKRIAFLRKLVEELPGSLEPVDNFMDGLPAREGMAVLAIRC
jgi:tetrahydromethanopterin S-methyltransferase subunit B